MTISLDLGSGPHPKNPFKADIALGLDVAALSDAVQACELGIDPLPFANSSVDFVTAFDLIEHIPRTGGQKPNANPFIYLMNEVWRVMKPGGQFYAQTPAYPFPSAFSDPTHVNVITADTVRYFAAEKLGDGSLIADDRLELGRRYGFKGRFTALRNYSSQTYGHQIWLLVAEKAIDA